MASPHTPCFVSFCPSTGSQAPLTPYPLTHLRISLLMDTLHFPDSTRASETENMSRSLLHVGSTLSTRPISSLLSTCSSSPAPSTIDSHTSTQTPGWTPSFCPTAGRGHRPHSAHSTFSTTSQGSRRCPQTPGGPARPTPRKAPVSTGLHAHALPSS